MRTKIDLYFKIVEPKITQEQFITHLASLDSKFGIIATNQDLSLFPVQIGNFFITNLYKYFKTPLLDIMKMILLSF